MARPRKPIQTLPFDPKFKRKLMSMLEKGKVEIPAFGVFEVVRIPQKTLYHNFSQRTRTIQSYKKLKFKQSKLLKNIL